MTQTKLTAFLKDDINSLAPAMKVGLLATVTPEGLPHVTLISSVMASSEKEMCFGQFTEGFSKKFIFTNPKVGWLAMSLDKNLWRGKASFTRTSKEGKDYDYYNNTPMFRYNAYFGVHTVYYMDLVDQGGKEALPMGKVIFAAVLSLIGRTLGAKPGRQAVLNTWTRAFLDKIDNLKFLSYVGADGYPVIIPCIQAQSLDGEHVLFSTGVYNDEIAQITAGAPLAIFAMALTMEDVLLRGEYLGMRRVGGVKAGVVRVNWVYNAMPPAPAQIYPAVEIEAVREF